MSFTKLFSSITESTVWAGTTAETKVVWVTMLAKADRRGRIWASIPGLANLAGVSIQDVEKALEIFLSPDPYSRTTEHEGRRIEVIDGGWFLLNYFKYREMRDQDDTREKAAERKRRERERAKSDVTPCHAMSHHVTAGHDNGEAEAEAEAEIKKAPNGAMSGKPDAAKRILEFLNEKTGRNYRAVASNLKPIQARMAEGYTEDECRMVVAQRCRKWATDDKMAEYLRPATLFNATKFNQYAGELAHA